ncbi:unnamed protein product [Adineta steineri]|uniref:Uncharacterized protein n=1 Tax=Adineta steineri TaxID=433720 RepID=A0A813YYS5_9BILA|nr:unnamed protein product [Adineta steineri]CAF1365135.1 unnamed protein product [Adineta steineri]CAF1390612.1 unnamed protein product [Adineta steineri]CAF3712725.1 unnamed protein product [Adineta steineri]CAF3880632.1 unnamed protein product [Adineta steineri]
MKHVNTNIELFLRTLLQNIGNNDICSIRSLCFDVASVNGDQMIENLRNRIKYEELFDKFTIKHVGDNICLQWK